LRLSLAKTALRYDGVHDVYVRVDDTQAADFQAGDLVWQTDEGGRKGGGVYYTREELVSHLASQAVVPRFAAHLDQVRRIAERDPATAAQELFDFAVLDPACGSAHFLVVAVNQLADMTVKFLANTPLPLVRDAIDRLRSGVLAGTTIEDSALLRRLVLKRSVYGVDVSPMGAEIAKISLWLASFVPGLSLSYLDRNVIVGNSLIGIGRPAELQSKLPLFSDLLASALARAGELAAQVATIEDRNPDEVDASQAADHEAQDATAGLQAVFDLWTAESVGLSGARAEAELHGPDIIQGRTSALFESATQLAQKHRFLHWPLAFPGVFARPRPGFDAVIGNPPWQEVTVERLAFFARFAPGLRALPADQRLDAITRLLAERPELDDLLEREQEMMRLQRRYLASISEAAMAGDPDLYKFFCLRYGSLLRDEGSLGVVLPRNAFAAAGSAGFRRWLFEQNSCRRVDFLLNRRNWIFDTHPQFTIALLAADARPMEAGHRVRVAGTASSLDEWKRQSVSAALELASSALGPGWVVPLLRNQREADVLAKVRQGTRFPLGGGRWRCFAVRELDETNDKHLWDSASEGWPLWKGESFEQYDPHGKQARCCPDSSAVRAKVVKPRPGAGSLLAAEVSVEKRRQAVANELGRARVAFRDVTRATDSRSVRACMIPPHTFLLNSAPYLTVIDGVDEARACCLAVMNSIPFDWQARRFVEMHLNFFMLEGLVVPKLSDNDFHAIAKCAAELSCVDERFEDFAEGVGASAGALTDEERRRHRIEIDARIARAWKLTVDDLDTIFADFTVDTVPLEYRRALTARLHELST